MELKQIERKNKYFLLVVSCMVVCWFSWFVGIMILYAILEKCFVGFVGILENCI